MPAAQVLGPYCRPRSPAEVTVAGQDAFCVFEVVVAMRFLFHELHMFMEGLMKVMPTTSRVEGDFSLMSYHHNSYFLGLTDFSLEGIMYANQYKALQKVAAPL